MPKGLLDILKILISETKESHFNPEGGGYDYDTAIKSGGSPEMQPDGYDHWFSLDPETGMVLKGRKHPTWNMMEEEEKRRGSMIVRGNDGRYYSVPNPKAGISTLK